MTKARDRIKFPYIPTLRFRSSDHRIYAYMYIRSLLRALGDIVDLIESSDPPIGRGGEAASSYKRVFCNWVVDRANSIAPEFEGTIKGRSSVYIRNLPMVKEAQVDIANKVFEPLQQDRENGSELDCEASLKTYEEILAAIIGGVLREIETWKDLPDTRGVHNEQIGHAPVVSRDAALKSRPTATPRASDSTAVTETTMRSPKKKWWRRLF
ncbi:hypothetical protein N431DRAFT_119231 [Stipitochalara longipes BDJ]|nr:hypothetical protein N431DRAFT_119231 [Stipitochalara longipes BDJ]